MLVPSFVARACGVLAGLTLGVVLPAQIKLPDPVQGRFRVDPKGHGPDVFRDFSSAVRFLSVIGVTGPLELVVAPGSHEGRLRFFPTPGQKPGQKILIRSAVPGEARLSAADSAILELLDTAHDLVLDGFVFETKGRDAAILVSGASKNIEIRNCRCHSKEPTERVRRITSRFMISRQWM